MRVKVIRKGFSDKIRMPGETFEFAGDACPDWCVEMDKVKDAKSVDLKASDAVAYMIALKTENEVKAFMKGEERKSVKDAAVSKLEEIMAAQ